MAGEGSSAASAVVRCALAPDPERARASNGGGAVRRPVCREGAADSARGGRGPQTICIAGGLAVRVGMNGEARILTGRRTLLARALEPLRALRERAFVE